MNHLTQVQCQKADMIEATVWDAVCILYFTSVQVVKLFWSLYHVVVAVSSAVWWKSAPKWQWIMNVLGFFFVSESVQFNEELQIHNRNSSSFSVFPSTPL